MRGLKRSLVAALAIAAVAATPAAANDNDKKHDGDKGKARSSHHGGLKNQSDVPRKSRPSHNRGHRRHDGRGGAKNSRGGAKGTRSNQGAQSTNRRNG